MLLQAPELKMNQKSGLENKSEYLIKDYSLSFNGIELILSEWILVAL